jgi:hypothetical protein
MSAIISRFPQLSIGLQPLGLSWFLEFVDACLSYRANRKFNVETNLNVFARDHTLGKYSPYGFDPRCGSEGEAGGAIGGNGLARGGMKGDGGRGCAVGGDTGEGGSGSG